MSWLYVPLLTAKQAEWDAIAWLPRDSGPVLPLLHIPPIPSDKGTRIDPEDWIRAFLNAAGMHWNGRPLLVDAHDRTQPARRPLSPGAYRHVGLWSSAVGITPLPVLAPGDGDELIRSAASMAGLVGHGAAIRLQPADIALLDGRDDLRLRQRLERLLALLRLAPGDLILLVDLMQISLQDPPGNAIPRLRVVLSTLPYLHEWRAVVLAATSAPPRIEDRFNAPPLKDPVPRREWQIWHSLLDLGLPRHPDFGDYAGFPATLPPETGHVRHPSLRYSTLDGRQLLARRRAVPGQGFGAFADICQDVMSSPYYLGAAFSWGDEEIRRRAGWRSRPGNARIWREIAVEHHLVTVLHQLAMTARPEPVRARDSLDRAHPASADRLSGTFPTE